MTRKERLSKAPQDRELWQKLYYKHQQSYLRRRLNALKLLWDGHTMKEVCSRLEIDPKTLRNWVDMYLSGGFTVLLSPVVSNKKGKGKLSDTQLRVLKYIILHKQPADYGYDRYIWTLELISRLLQDKWGVELKKSRIETILNDELQLSHQKFHRDYLNADKAKQVAFVQDMKQRLTQADEEEALVWFDEFSISTRPNAGYGWAEKNTSPTIPSNEKKENAIMGF